MHFHGGLHFIITCHSFLPAGSSYLLIFFGYSFHSISSQISSQSSRFHPLRRFPSTIPLSFHLLPFMPFPYAENLRMVSRLCILTFFFSNPTKSAKRTYPPSFFPISQINTNSPPSSPVIPLTLDPTSPTAVSGTDTSFTAYATLLDVDHEYHHTHSEGSSSRYAGTWFSLIV